jgi:signal transduction histidine kinase
VIRETLRSLLAEPAAPDPPTRVWRDWVLVAVFIIAACLEATLRSNVSWRPFALVVTVVLVFSLLYRRTHPLATVVVTFGFGILSSLSVFVGVSEPVGLDTMVYFVLLLYSLVRWGSGRQVAIGLGVILVAYGLGIASDPTGIEDALAAAVFLMLTATLGASVRYWTTARTRAIDQVRLREREQLARELHDVVAHHVSAIAICAQAGRLVASADPDAAQDALAVIDKEASRTLAEMRQMVGALRDGDEAEITPQRGIEDLDQLASGTVDAPRLRVAVTGDIHGLAPSVNAAIYRIAQESVTNVARHAHHATTIDIQVVADDNQVSLNVHDDGRTSPGSRNSTGYGIVGMTERAVLLGGSLSAGPDPRGGWVVRATLPLAGAPR